VRIRTPAGGAAKPDQRSDAAPSPQPYPHPGSGHRQPHPATPTAQLTAAQHHSLTLTIQQAAAYPVIAETPLMDEFLEKDAEE
jgi:hypothetical protein